LEREAKNNFDVLEQRTNPRLHPFPLRSPAGSPPSYELERMGQGFHETPKDSFSGWFLFHGFGAADDIVGFRA
jgi:hypothetical protein